MGPLTPDFYSYTFNVDGVRIVDPKNPMTKPGLNSLDSLFLVPGEEAEFETTKDVPHGDVRAVWYRSGTLDMPRRMHVYTPPGYEGGAEKYPVLYLLHGSGDEDSGWSTIGRAGFILDNLIAAKKAMPMLVVMPNGSLPRSANLPRPTPGTPPTPEALAAREAAQNRFTDELLKEVVPTIEKTFRVKAATSDRALAGLSMGGGQTLRVLTTNPDQFAYVGIWSARAVRRERRRVGEAERGLPRGGRQGQRVGQAARDLRRRQGLLARRLEGARRGAGEARDQARASHQRRRPHLDQLASLPQRVGPEAVSIAPSTR